MAEDGIVRRLDEKFYTTLDRLDLWLKSRGITQRNRLRIYRDNLIQLRELQKTKDLTQVHSELTNTGRLTEILSTFVEGIEVVETWPTLLDAQIEIPDDLLRRVLSGPADAFREDEKSNQGRNAMFELSMGAMIARQGLRPTFSEANPDIAFELDGRCVKMECKRLISANKLFDRIQEGIEQLSKTVRSDKADLGIVAVSLTRLFNRGDLVLVGSEPHEILSRELDTAIRSMEYSLSTLMKPYVSALLFYLSSPFNVPGKGFTPQAAGTVFPMNMNEMTFLRRLSDLFKL